MQIHSQQELEMIQYFNSRALSWDESLIVSDDLYVLCKKLCGIKSNDTVLDLACGTGVLFPAYLACNVSQLVGIDISDKMIDIASEKYHHHPQVETICHNVLTYETNSFDHVILFNAYPHFFEKRKLAVKAASFLKSGGRYSIIHNIGKYHINTCHSHVPSSVKTPLLSAKEESRYLRELFHVDILCDTDYFYMISGTKI